MLIGKYGLRVNVLTSPGGKYLDGLRVTTHGVVGLGVVEELTNFS